MTANQLIEVLKGNDDKARGEAWQGAGPLGAAAVMPLAELMSTGDMEAGRCARRALWRIVRHAGRPSARSAEMDAVAKQLVPLLAAGNTNVRREFVWMLSEIGDGDAVPALAQLMAVPELREDARAALQRIPGKKSLQALKAALGAAPEPYQAAIAVSLRARGETVRSHPPAKLLPTRNTAIKQPAA
jgi:HEAT repeat protein